MHVIITKSSATSAIVTTLFNVVYFPLLYCEVSNDFKGFDCNTVLFTSVNAVKAYARIAMNNASKVAFAVGNRTARFAYDIGFGEVINASGNMQDLLTLIINSVKERNIRLIYYPRGNNVAHNVPDLLRDIVAVKEEIAYRMLAINHLPDEVAAIIYGKSPYATLFYSGMGADNFVRLTKAVNISFDKAFFYAIGKNAAKILSVLNPHVLRIAATPDEDGLLKMLYNDHYIK